MYVDIIFREAGLGSMRIENVNPQSTWLNEGTLTISTKEGVHYIIPMDVILYYVVREVYDGTKSEEPTK